MSFRRLGELNAEATRPRPIVEFSHASTVNKIIPGSAMLRPYETSFNKQKYLVFVSKSLNEEQKLKEQKLLGKRRNSR